MKKSDVKALFGGTESAMGKKLNRSQPAINQWDEELTTDSKILVFGAASIFGIKLPIEWKRDLKAEIEKAAS